MCILWCMCVGGECVNVWFMHGVHVCSMQCVGCVCVHCMCVVFGVYLYICVVFVLCDWCMCNVHFYVVYGLVYIVLNVYCVYVYCRNCFVYFKSSRYLFYVCYNVYSVFVYGIFVCKFGACMVCALFVGYVCGVLWYVFLWYMCAEYGVCVGWFCEVYVLCLGDVCEGV